MKLVLYSGVCFILFSSWIWNTDPSVIQADPGDQDTVPSVCMIGDYEEAIDNMAAEHELLLLSVCEDDMQVAFEKWMSMLQEMEIYAESIEFDLKGLKLWLNVYWYENGAIRHISFFPKPRSRNMDNKEIEAFLKSFMKRYRFPIASEEKFAHYGIAHFPTFANGAMKVQR